ncbi:MAG TPA: maltose alpha-D-glucosyltransferase [Dermatophilaceae bacterium]|nr:maltose alpha-D-glucosyltransferase [Dermatophilaceae bacterium]
MSQDAFPSGASADATADATADASHATDASHVTDASDASDATDASHATDGAASAEGSGEVAEPGPEEVVEHEAPEITYAEQFFPARPRRLRPRARLRHVDTPRPLPGGEPVGTNPDYVQWLADQSMLADATRISGQFSGQGSMWQNPFAYPAPRRAIETASVWYTAYPISQITPPGKSFLATLGDRGLWESFQRIGIRAIHTGPVKISGGLRGYRPTPSVDGHFDRISTRIDPTFGTEEEFRQMCTVAAEFGGTVIDDIVPGHTGKGADWRLAEMKVGDYPGIYHMVEIDPHDWHLLPEVPPERDSVNIDAETEARLEKGGYIIGRLQRVIFYAPGVKDTNWSVTREVVGPDGVSRRWVYLHYFKQGQPSINWLDPSFAGMKLVIGDALHSLGDLGSGALRLDANGFLGVEKTTEGDPAWSEGHPLSEAANQLIAGMVRKVGGFSFQELNLTIDDIKAFSDTGADLSYDFVNRPAYHHALATGETEFLRLTLNASLELGVHPVSLVHALQNHDEMTYELVHFATLHKDQVYDYRGAQLRGEDLAEVVRGDLQRVLTGEQAPYNLVFTTNGIASTIASIICATLGFTDIDALTPDQIGQVKQAHLLVATFNAMQPGVFALSGWDLLGALTIPGASISDLINTGDTRWIHRGAYDLMNWAPGTEYSQSGMPRATCLYGALPDQLADSDSFASQLARMLDVRERYGIATSEQVDVPMVSNKALLVLVHRLDEGETLHVSVMNFGREEVHGTVSSAHLPPAATVLDMFTEEHVGEVDDLHSFSVTLAGHTALSLYVVPAPPVANEPAEPGTEVRATVPA